MNPPIRKLLVFAAVICSGISVRGEITPMAPRTQELNNADSPNGQYTVKAVESGTPLRITYDI